MRKPPRVTVMIPTYNQAHLLQFAIEGVLAQDYPDLEILVSDDASTDETPLIVERYQDARLRYVRRQKNLGRVLNYQKTLSEATGDWVLNLDGDDYLTDPSYISEAIEKTNEKIVLVIGGAVSCDEGESVARFPTSLEWEIREGADFFWDWNLTTQVPHLASLYRRELARSLDFYRSDILFTDCESLRRIVLHGDVLLRGKVVGVWRGHAQNASKALGAKEHVENLDMILRPYQYGLSRGLDPARLERWKNENLLQYSRIHLDHCLNAGALPEAAGYLTRIRHSHPRIFLSCLRGAIRDVRPLAKLLLLWIGGKRLLDSIRLRKER